MVKAYAQRFKRRKEPRYGSINKGFTEPELQRFFRSIASEKFALLFKYQANLGLRVGEVCQLHISNIDFAFSDKITPLKALSKSIPQK